MKRVFAFFLAAVMLFVMAACGSEESGDPGQTGQQGGNNQQSQVAHTGKKIEGEITAGNVFSEGLAFVALNGDKSKVYCINKEGYIVFETDQHAPIVQGEIKSKFMNGLAKVGKGICDTSGKLTMPEDVGVTAFSELALKGGYILAERVTSDYASTKKELGVMDTKFQWIVEPNEELYQAVGGIDMIPTSTNCFYHNDYFYAEYSGKYIHLKTGELKEQLEEFPSKQWVSSSNAFYDYKNNEMLTLAEHATIQIPAGTRFVDGFAPVRFVNQESGKHYMTVIDEKGQFQFEPVETMNFQQLRFDGQNVLLLDDPISPNKLACYSKEGQLLGSFEINSLESRENAVCTITEGVIMINCCGISGNGNVYYFSCDFTQLPG